MDLLWAALGVVLVLLGLVTLMLPGVPGAAIVYVGILLVAWSDDFTRIGPAMLVVLAFVAFAGSIVDNIAGLLGARYGGASGWGMLGAALGALVGLAFGLPGVILGPAVGALVFEYAKNPDFRRAAGAGAGSVAGFLMGVVAKYVFTLLMVGVALLAYLF